MLVLSRMRGEKIIVSIGDIKIEITMLDIRGDKVRIGIHAPDDVVIHREEVWNAIQSTQWETAKPPEEGQSGEANVDPN